MEDLRKELDQVVMEIGRVRAGGEGDIEALRERKADIEREISEQKAEGSYREAQAQADAEAERQAGIKAKLEIFGVQSEDFTKQFAFVESALKSLQGASLEFNEAVNAFLNTPNPTLLLGSIWKDLPRDQQKEVEGKLHKVFDLRAKVPKTLEALNPLENLNGYVSAMAFQLGKYRVAPMTKPVSRGMRTTTRKSNAPESTVIMPQKRNKGPVDHGRRPVPRFNKNKPRGEQFVGSTG